MHTLTMQMARTISENINTHFFEGGDRRRRTKTGEGIGAGEGGPFENCTRMGDVGFGFSIDTSSSTSPTNGCFSIESSRETAIAIESESQSNLRMKKSQFKI